MPPRKSKRQLADDAWQRCQQVDLEQQIALMDPRPRTVREAVEIATIPQACPSCHVLMTLAHGWSTVRAPEREGYARILCYHCGAPFIAPAAEVAGLVRSIQTFHADLAAKAEPLPKKRKRVRGAE